MESLVQFLTSAVAHPVQQGLAIVLGTFILEDATTAITALVAQEGLVPAQLGLASLYFGIIAGDLGLYGVGRLARRFQWIRGRLDIPQLTQMASWLDRRLGAAVLASRFMPGLRLPTYTACGLFALPFGRFALSVVVATLLWTTLLFWACWGFGAYVLSRLGTMRWVASAILVLTLVAVLRQLSRRERRLGHP